MMFEQYTLSNHQNPEKDTDRLDELIKKVGELSATGIPADLEDATRLLREIDEIFNPVWPGTSGCLYDDKGLILEKAFGSRTLALQFSADGRRLAGVDQQGTLRISALDKCDLPGRTFDLAAAFAAFKPDCLALSPNFKLCAVGNYARLCLIDLTTPAPMLRVQDDVGFNTRFVSMKFNHNSDAMLAVCRHDVYGNGRAGDYSMDVYEIAVRAKRMSLDVSSTHGPRLGERLGLGNFTANDREVLFSEERSLMSMHSRSGFLAGGTSRIMDFAAKAENLLHTLAPAANRLAQSVDRLKIEVCLLEDRKTPVRGELTLDTKARRLCFDHTGSRLAIADEVDRIHVYSVEKQKDGSLLLHKERQLHARGIVSEVAFNRDGSMLACTNEDGALTVFRV